MLAEHLDHPLGRTVALVHGDDASTGREVVADVGRRPARCRRGTPAPAGRRPRRESSSVSIETERADPPPRLTTRRAPRCAPRRCRAATRRRGRSARCLPDAAAAQLAPRNSSLVATRSWARVRTRSGSSTSTWVSCGSRSTSISISSTSAGASDSMPSTAMPSASLSVISRSCGWAWPSSAARRRTSSVSSSSRHGGAHSRSTLSIVRWSATAKLRISSTSSPKNSTRSGCSSVGGKTSTMPPRTANSPRFSTRSTREYAAPTSRRTTSSSSSSWPRHQLDRLEVGQPLDLRLQHRADRRDDDLERPVVGLRCRGA